MDIISVRSGSGDAYHDVTKSDFLVKLDPQDFSCHWFFNEPFARVELKLTYEQQEKIIASILGISQAKMQAIRNLLKTEENLAQDQEVLKKIRLITG